MSADYSRIHRLLKILMLIQSGSRPGDRAGSAGFRGGAGGWTARRLAGECGTTQRTIYRDLKMLEAAGVPYFFDQESKSYTVRKDFFMPPVQLTFEETLAMSALAGQIGAREQVPFTKSAARAIEKVRGQLPPKIRAELERIEPHVAIHLAASTPPESSADVYERVRQAIAEKRALRCAYESINHARAADAAVSSTNGNGEEEVFAFQPYALFFDQRAWYTVGLHGGRGAVRCLKLNRFTRCELTDEGYSIPRSFSLGRHLGNAWRMIRGKKRYDVELRFDPDFAETIADTQWHPTQSVTWNRDHSITFRCSVDGLDEIVWWVLSMGPHCQVRKPKALAERVKALAEKMVELYAVPAGG
jgi:predicted DNA-binding transcriptional regulator YafY